MSEKNLLEEVVAAIQKLLGFGSTEQITGVVNQVVDAKGDEAGIVSALAGLFGDAIPQADLSSAVSGLASKGNGIDLGNVLELFQGIGDKAGGFDKVAGLMGAASAADQVTSAVHAVSGEAVPSIDEAVSGIQKLMGFGSTEQVTSVVNQVVDAKGDEGGIVSALTGFFGDAIPKPDLLSVVTSILGKGNGIGLGNILELFGGIGDKIGGFDKIAGLFGAASSAGKITDAVKGVAGSVTGAVSDAAGATADAAKDAAGSVTGAVKDAAGNAADAAGNVTGSVTGAVKDAAGAAVGAAGSVTGAVKDAAGTAVNAVQTGAGAAKGAVTGSAQQVAAEPAKKRKKWPIVLGVIVGVIALAGVGMWIWHEQPSFCNAFCHTSMDAYLESYDQQDNASGVDKYGNDVANTHAMLAVSHKSQNLACLDCHIPAIDQQIGEVMETISGGYTVYERANGQGYALEEVKLADLQVNAHLDNTSGLGDEFCLRSGCHDYDRSTLAKVQIDGMIKQPHMWLTQDHMNIEFACGDCHKSHRASVNVCTQCHEDAATGMPEGWLTFKEGQAANVG